MKTSKRSEDTRKHIPSRLKGATLIERGLLRGTRNEPVRLLPTLNIVKIGGQSMIDYGRSAVYPLVEEILEVRHKHKMLLVTGGGTRARHVYDIALDLGLPTGMLATLGEQVANQNAIMLYGLLAAHGGVRLAKDQMDELPQYLASEFIPIVNGMPPYHYWEPPPDVGSIPAHRTDVGAYLIAEVMGAKSMIFVKDERGLYTDNPKTNRKAKFIPKIEVNELLEMDLPDLIVERPVLQMMLKARFARRIQIINGHEKGNLTRALDGEDVGTVIYVDAK